MSPALVCEWKQEPLSPLFADEAALVHEDEALYWTDFEQGNNKLETELSSPASPDLKSEESSLLEDLDRLEDLDEWIKQEPFSNWEKMLPMYDLEPAAVTPVKPEPTKSIPDTQILLREFETVFDAVNHGTLTPPQSPPYEQPMLTTLEPLATQRTTKTADPIEDYTNIIVYPRSAAVSVPLDYAAPTSQSSIIAHELAVVDELVRSRAQDMVQWSGGPTSPSSSNSGGSSFEDCGNSSFGDCSSDDPEWIPETVEDEQPDGAKTRKRSKPYSRVPPEDKKVRKKEQNKNAATRYRMKKKAEVEEILGEERGLQNENDEISNKISDLQREIKYLKGLMRDLFRAKGLIN